MTPTQLSLRLLRQRGAVAEVVERWNAFSRTRKDLFGFVDIVAIEPTQDPGRPFRVVFIQTTSVTNVSARVRKIREECFEAFYAAKNAGVEVVVHGWRKDGRRWALAREESLQLGDGIADGGKG